MCRLRLTIDEVEALATIVFDRLVFCLRGEALVPIWAGSFRSTAGVAAGAKIQIGVALLNTRCITVRTETSVRIRVRDDT